MKISDKIQKARSENRTWWSFEYFPPKTAQGVANLFDRMERMYKLGPEFIDITWGAGGRTSDLTSQLVKDAQSIYGLETCMHLTCTNMEVEKVEIALRDAKGFGCRNILALRGDPPRGQEEWTATEGGFEHAIDLVKYIRKHYGDYFDIAVAGFPEGHPDAPDRATEMANLKAKIDSGADLIFTQMFYDIDVFLDWVKAVREAGITVPIVPGVMPIQNWGGFERTTSMSKTIVPKHFYEALEPVKDDDAEVRRVGTDLVAQMCRQILNSPYDINGIHFYTMNLERAVSMILEELQLIPHTEIVNPLPWRPALTEKRREEGIRPIFWANRTKSYLDRTHNWDEFPNGRWGDSRSPAFGEIDIYGMKFKQDDEECRKTWGYPRSIDAIKKLFASYIRGQIGYLPWSDKPVAAETTAIDESLAQLNEAGFLTINSQPAIDGIKSEDKTFGWGPRNGYVYQKAYLEFFIHPSVLDDLVRRIEKVPSLTYYAVNKTGDLRTNTQSDGPNAVTWGVFPGKEIIQPTIVEATSFMAWKDEAFEIGRLWARLYPRESEYYKVISGMMDQWYLVNMVHNDFRAKDKIFDVFQGLSLANAGVKTNGIVNGFANHVIHEQDEAAEANAIHGDAAAEDTFVNRAGNAMADGATRVSDSIGGLGESLVNVVLGEPSQEQRA